ncbi:MAG: TIGR03617 family F420-dependent LLM class oxidoreductase [Mycobacteriales bacterium]|nr:TIGR03617 family F420-dependent LLM class oxidoreductase [Mycobacteriales bacterium]
MRLDTRLDADLTAVPGAVRQLADAGLAGVFTYEGPGDVFLPLGVAAATGVPLDLYSNVAIALPRSPMHLAHLAHDLQRTTGGRFALGLGSQVKRHVEDRYGSVWESPVEQLRECVLAVKAIQRSWATGEPLAFEGRWTRHTYCPPVFVPPALDGPPAPVLVGAMGPRMTAMAVEVADGLLVHPFCTDRSVAELTLPQTSAAPAGFQVVGQAIVGVARDELEHEAATAGVRGLVAFYASTPAYRQVLDVHGWGDLQVELRDLTRAGRWAELPGAVPQEVVDAIALVGTPAEVAAGLRRRFGGCDRVALSLPAMPTLGTLAELTALAA